ncbi:hypothetical protein LCGC14_2111080 [marine sediment metagenome]|uniref:Uncharacterized protein n=1 Tax=marine sediment metagenome TaxID=412755 RepID=A0A0F9EU91_9ZZZZ
MSEARRLLRLYGGHLAWCEARNCHIPGATKTRCNCGFYAAAYLAQPITKCEEREGELVAIKKVVF